MRVSVAILAAAPCDGSMTGHTVENYVGAGRGGETAGSIASSTTPGPKVEDHVDAPPGEPGPHVIEKSNQSLPQNVVEVVRGFVADEEARRYHSSSEKRMAPRLPFRAGEPRLAGTQIAVDETDDRHPSMVASTPLYCEYLLLPAGTTFWRKFRRRGDR
ncbi:MAG: hypothetical protein M3O70_13750 [Actinomycetota bacterium]|nr:hypothetical protein [Actinomycetota bacterium]